MWDTAQKNSLRKCHTCIYFSTVSIERLRADFPSSGLGNGTVGKVGSGSKQ